MNWAAQSGEQRLTPGMKRRHTSSRLFKTLRTESEAILAQERVGGYEDCLRQRRNADAEVPAPVGRAGSGANAATIATKLPRAQRKPSYKEQQELEQLPARIEASRRSSSSSKRQSRRPISTSGRPLRSMMRCPDSRSSRPLLMAAYTRWDALDSRTSQ